MTKYFLLLVTACFAFSAPALANTSSAKGSSDRKVAQADELHWSSSGETCVFYDYRPMIQKNERSDIFFAIEPQSGNGGAREFKYKQKDFKSAKEAYMKAFNDLNGLMQSGRCDGITVYYPTAAKPDAPL